MFNVDGKLSKCLNKCLMLIDGGAVLNGRRPVLNGRRPGYEIPENVEIWAILPGFHVISRDLTWFYVVLRDFT